MATIDNESEPGAWKRELERHPWGYGQSQTIKLEAAISNIRTVGLWREANTVEQEIKTLQSELAHVRRELEKIRDGD
jgi:hypothetical protein